MAETSEGSRLLCERAWIDRRCDTRRDDLDGDGAAERQIFSLIDGSHPSVGELRDDPITFSQDLALTHGGHDDLRNAHGYHRAQGIGAAADSSSLS